MRKRIVGSIAFVVVAVSAYGPGYCFADGGPGQKYPALAAVEAQLDHCREHKGNIGEMLCAVEADKSVDAILNSLYGKIIAKLKQADDPNHDTEDRHELLKRLIASERAWVTYREAECSHASAIYLGGSGEGTALTYCRLEMRTVEPTIFTDFMRRDFPIWRIEKTSECIAIGETAMVSLSSVVDPSRVFRLAPDVRFGLTADTSDLIANVCFSSKRTAAANRVSSAFQRP